MTQVPLLVNRLLYWYRQTVPDGFVNQQCQQSLFDALIDLSTPVVRKNRLVRQHQPGISALSEREPSGILLLEIVRMLSLHFINGAIKTRQVFASCLCKLVPISCGNVRSYRAVIVIDFLRTLFITE